MDAKLTGAVSGIQSGDAVTLIEIVWKLGGETEAAAQAAGRGWILTSYANRAALSAAMTAAGNPLPAGMTDSFITYGDPGIAAIAAFPSAGYALSSVNLVSGQTYTPAVRVTESRSGSGAYAGGWSAASPFIVWSVYDSFTDTDGTLLNNHISNTGHGWVKYLKSGAANAEEPGTAVIASGVLKMGDVTNWSSYYNGWTPPSANYTVQLVFTISTLGNSAGGVMGRVDPATGTFYGFQLMGQSAGNYYLFKNVNGVQTVLATGTISTPAVGNYTVALVMNGTSIVGKINGTVIASVTDASITAAGKAGIRGDWTGVAPAGITHIDSYMVFTN